MPDVGRPGPEGAPAFDAQATRYDSRAGFPPGVAEAVAGAIVRVSGARADDLVLELGAGTGEIGAHLAAILSGYVALDNSPAMLEIFRARALPATPRFLLADGDATWPIPAASARVIFASRVIHLLRPEHVAREATRVCQPGGYVMLGRVNRDPESVKERLRRHRQHLLREVGIQSRQGEAGSRRVIERLAGAGWDDLGRNNVIAWTGATSAGEVLAEWAMLSRMGSVEVEAATREQILEETRTWAVHEFGDLDRRWPYHEQYVLDIAQLPKHRNA